VGAGKKTPASIIRGTCAFESKFEAVSRDLGHVSRLVERNKNFFRKIEISQNLPSKFVDNRGYFRQIRAKGTGAYVIRIIRISHRELREHRVLC
jgi:hypothetical protein